MNSAYPLILHHFGCLTRNIKASVEIYRNLGFQNFSDIFSIEAQNVKVCFVSLGNDVFLEFVEFTESNKALKKIWESKNPYYHIGYKVMKVESAVEELEARGFYLVNTFASEAFAGKKCAFLYSPEMQLIELIEI